MVIPAGRHSSINDVQIETRTLKVMFIFQALLQLGAAYIVQKVSSNDLLAVKLVANSDLKTHNENKELILQFL